MRLILPPGDLVMMSRQLRNLKRLAEGTPAGARLPDQPLRGSVVPSPRRATEAGSCDGR